MAKYNRINWQTGMEVTPQVLINADNFQIEQQNITRRLQIMPCYGILPESNFNADIEIEGNTLFIKNLVIHAISPRGELIDINEQGEEPQRLDLNQYTSGYITIDNSLNCQIVENVVEINSSVPIAKISDNIVNFNYIPPCIFINSHYKLLEVFEQIVEKTENIITQIKEQDKYKSISFPLSLLEIELKSYSKFETPADLFLIIKKIAYVFKSNVTETLENTEILINKTYCHTEIYDIILLLLDSILELEEFSKAPVKVEEPKIQKIQIAVR